MLEYGIESTFDSTLTFINRGHTFAEAEQAIIATAQRGIYTGAHLILGLPHETRDMLLASAKILNHLPINALKLHQLQLIKGTTMALQYEQHPEWFSFFEVNDYIELLVDFLERLNPDIAIERFVSQSPKELLIMPHWELKNFEFTAKVEKRLKERDTWQGKKSKDERQ
jgi:radical SAM protein (TIGR01212 family)